MGDTECQEYHYPISAYYGIFYAAEFSEPIRAAIEGKNLEAARVYISDDSDVEPTQEYIAAEEMTQRGTELGGLDLDPRRLIRHEERCKAEVEFLTDLYDELIAKIKDGSLEVPIRCLYVGWRVLSCERE